MRLLGVFAHPLDSSLLCGGTFARYASAGAETMTVTATGRDADRSRSLRAARAIGTRHVLLLGYEPGELAGLTPTTLEEIFADVYRSFQPQVVITLGPDEPGSLTDHHAVHRRASAAFRGVRLARDPSTRPPVRLYYAGLPRRLVPGALAALPEAGIAAACAAGGSFEASESSLTAVIDIGSHRQAKLNAIQADGNAGEADPGLTSAARVFSREFFRRAFPEPWVSGLVENDLLAGLTVTAPSPHAGSDGAPAARAIA